MWIILSIILQAGLPFICIIFRVSDVMYYFDLYYSDMESIYKHL